MKMNPLQLQIFSHFRDRIVDEQKKIEKAQAEMQQFRDEYPDLMQKIIENDLTARKVQSVEAEAAMYKLIGPGLFPMGREEVATEIAGRLELLRARLKVVEGALKEKSEVVKNSQEKLVNLDSEFKVALQKAA